VVVEEMVVREALPGREVVVVSGVTLARIFQVALAVMYVLQAPAAAAEVDTIIVEVLAGTDQVVEVAAVPGISVMAWTD
jgi:hypothetical protein